MTLFYSTNLGAQTLPNQLNMASAFWTLEDGRGFARRWSGMAYMLELITDELSIIDERKEFYTYLEKIVFREHLGDTYNGYGGFIRGNENIMLDIDLRTFAPKNRELFWKAAQRALTKLRTDNSIDEEDGHIYLLTTLLDMHKRIKKGEDPMLLNDLRIVEPAPNLKLGPGWDEETNKA